MKTLYITDLVNNTAYPNLIDFDDGIDKCIIDIKSIREWTNSIDLKTNYEWVVEQNNLLLQLTDGQVNLIDHGWVSKWLVKQFKRYKCNDILFDEILQDEAEWLEKATHGGYVKHPPAGDYHIYTYDISGAYLSSLNDPNMNYPVKRGTFEIIDKLPCFYGTYTIMYGLYRVNIDGESPKFYKNSSNIYDNRSLNVAIAEKLKVSLIQDGQPNALRYFYKTGQLVSSKLLFNGLCDYLWDLKMKAPKNCLLPKFMCSSLWGALCFRHKIPNRRIIPFGETIELEENEDIFDMKPDGSIIVCQKGIHYSHPIARIKPFLLGQQRFNFYIMALRPYWNTIIRAYTDSIWVTQPIPKWETQEKKLGCMCTTKHHNTDVTVWYEPNGKIPQFIFK